MSFGHSIFTDATDDLVPRGEGAAPLLLELGKVTPKPTAPEAGRPFYPAVSGDPAVDLVVRRGPQQYPYGLLSAISRQKLGPPVCHLAAICLLAKPPRVACDFTRQPAPIAKAKQVDPSQLLTRSTPAR